MCVFTYLCMFVAPEVGGSSGYSRNDKKYDKRIYVYQSYGAIL